MRAVVVVVFLAIIGPSTTQARTAGLKSELFRRKTDYITDHVTRGHMDIRCAQACLRLGYGECNVIRMDATSGCHTTLNNLQVSDSIGTREFEIVFQDGCLIKVTQNANYETASDECRRLKGSLASYEQLVSAVNYGAELTCDHCWLISGEVTFTPVDILTTVQTSCELLESAIRWNIYPDMSAMYPCFYCYIYSNPSTEVQDYHSACRLLHLRYDDGSGYIYTEADRRCQGLGGHLAMPMEVYNVSLTGVDVCTPGWFSNDMGGACMVDSSGTRFYNILTGYQFQIWVHDDGESAYSAFCSVADYDPDQYPFPSHGVVNIRGVARYTLSYNEAGMVCMNLGGSLATRIQIQLAHEAGYEVSNEGWLMDQYVLHWCTPADGCQFNTQMAETNQFNGYCYFPKGNTTGDTALFGK